MSSQGFEKLRCSHFPDDPRHAHCLQGTRQDKAGRPERVNTICAEVVASETCGVFFFFNRFFFLSQKSVSDLKRKLAALTNQLETLSTASRSNYAFFFSPPAALLTPASPHPLTSGSLLGPKVNGGVEVFIPLSGMQMTYFPAVIRVT